MPVIWLCVYVIAAPAAIIGFYTMVLDGIFSHHTTMPAGRAGIKRLSGRYRFKDRLWELNCGILGLGLSVGAAFTITGALKNATGKPRPDLISRSVAVFAKLLAVLTTISCLIKDDLINRSAPYILQNVTICTQPSNYILQDGFKSFPSGHSSGTSILSAHWHQLMQSSFIRRSFLSLHLPRGETPCSRCKG